jgi:S-adenosylhomocysteine hydrolase
MFPLLDVKDASLKKTVNNHFGTLRKAIELANQLQKK